MTRFNLASYINERLSALRKSYDNDTGMIDLLSSVEHGGLEGNAEAIKRAKARREFTKVRIDELMKLNEAR
jgi:hypothetical protein